MPSRFPGMDPYIEGQVFAEFHDKLIDEIQVALAPLLRPRYVARIQERVHLEHYLEEEPHLGVPDVAITHDGQPPGRGAGGEVRETSIEIRLRETREVVTVIEFLSSADKCASAAGRREYLGRREAILRSRANLVEIDLLRDGGRLPMGRPLPPADYYVIVSRARRRPMAEVWPVGLRDRLPTIPVPLAGADPDVTLDLQAVFTTLYDRAGYDYTLDYRQPIEPPLSDEDAAWAQSVLDGSSPS